MGNYGRLNIKVNRGGISICILISILILSCGHSVKKETNSFDIKIIKVGGGPGSVEVGDFNNDGKPDIAIAETSDNSITILLGNGKGDFSEPAGSPFPANKFPNDIVIADFNKDGNADLAIANTEVSYLTLLLGNGKGEFIQAPKSPFAVKSKPHTHGIATGDLDGDGNLDLVTDSWGENKIIALFGDGRGGFDNPTDYKVGSRPYQRLRTADVNNDGKPDIITTNLESKNATVLLGMGGKIFKEAQGSPFPAGDAPFGIAIGDVNGDHYPDLAIINSPSITAESKGKDGLTILLGDGSGKFTKLVGSPFQTGKSPSRIAINDLNGDGINDIVITNYNDRSIQIFYMGRKGVIQTNRVKVGNRPDGVSIQDINGDGKKDIIVSNYDDNTIMILFNK